MSVLIPWLIRSFILRIPYVRFFQIAFAAVLAVEILAYVLMAMGLCEMARRRYIRMPQLAYVPIAQLYVLGRLADMKNGGRLCEIILPSLAAAAAAAGYFLPAFPGAAIILAALCIGIAVFQYIALFDIFVQYSKVPALLLVLSVLLHVLGAVFIFTLRTKTVLPKNAGGRLRVR